MEYILETNSLGKKYGRSEVLKNLNMHIPKGSIYGLIGKNGAGKTTLIRVLCGLQKPNTGTYAIYGTLNKDKKISEARKRIGAIIESPSICLDMTAEDNVKEQYKVVGLPNYDGLNELLKLVRLENTDKKTARKFSLGMRQRLGLAIALVGNPDLLILDEPINGLDPEGIIEIRELILKLNYEKNITFLISSHYLDELSKIATHYCFIDKGNTIKEISAKDLSGKMKKKIELKVKDVKAYVTYLTEKGYDFDVVDNYTIHVFGNVSLTKLLSDLIKNNLEVESIREIEETLENYFLNLVGGD